MKSVGIICEYNPFHNGHLYHLKKVKELYPDYTIILVMSSSFLQRGETSIINKWNKTNIALYHGIDIVVELPFVFSTQSSDIFAKGSIEILKHLKVDILLFGSESNNIELLNNIADIKLSKNYNQLVKKNLKNGISYPSAISKTVYELTNNKIDQPNDILGINYIMEIKKQKANIKPICIKRTNEYHSTDLNNAITSATSIRTAIKKNIDIKSYVPIITYQHLNNRLHFIDNYYPYLKYKILTEIDQLFIYNGVDEGIENRIKKYIINSNSLDELIMNIKTKRYTYNRLMRMFTHILCNFKKDDAKKWQNIEYIRILGFSKNGQKYLNKVKKNIDIPIVTNYSQIKNDMLDFEFKITCVYASILNEKDKIKLIKSEYKNSPLIK